MFSGLGDMHVCIAELMHAMRYVYDLMYAAL